ncbi:MULTISPECIES: DUF2690 domain-containing protein [unclassified Streptomyces]|uniref:helix-turn-helix domain-containing protein n=1 Tax=unclassified Streptomyces TaxID=2593676 RepID=UPI00368643AD
MPGWKPLPEELAPEIRAFTERMRRLIDRSGLGVLAVAERTGHDRATWEAYLRADRPVPRSAVLALADVTGADAGSLAADAEHAERAWRRAGTGTAPGPGPHAENDGGTRQAAGDHGGTRPAAAPVAYPPGPPAPAAPDGAPAFRDGDGGADLGGDGQDRTLRIRRVDGDLPLAPAPGSGGGTARPAGGPPRTPVTGAVPPPRDRPPARTPLTRSRAVLLHAAAIVGAGLVVTAALLLVDLGGGGTDDGRAAPAPPTRATTPPPTAVTPLPAGATCAGPSCSGQDPEALGCGGPLATTVARTTVGGAQVEVRHSPACRAAWARISGAAPGDTVTVEAAGVTRRATLPAGTDTDAYTPMVPVAAGGEARACAALADGRAGCTPG